MYGHYPSPSLVQVYVADLHIEDAYHCEYQEEDSTQPLFSYSQREYVAVAEGKTLVSGQLVINFRYPGYLSVALQNAYDKLGSYVTDYKGREVSRHNKEVLATLDAFRKATRQDKFKLLADAARKGPHALTTTSLLARISESLQIRASQVPGDRLKLPSPLQATHRREGIVPSVALWIHYGNLNERHPAKEISGVVFIGESQTITASASHAGGPSSSGANIFEVYPFFGRTVNHWILDPTETRDRGASEGGGAVDQGL